MKLNDINDDVLIQYLLGTLSEEKKQQVEDLCFTNDDCFELLQAVEDELINNYVRGELGLEQRKAFDNYFLLAPERREKLEYEIVLMTSLSIASNPGVFERIPRLPQKKSLSDRVDDFVSGLNWIVKVSFVPALVILIALNSYLFLRVRHLSSDASLLKEHGLDLLNQNQELQEQLTSLSKKNEQLVEKRQVAGKQRRQLEQKLKTLQEPTFATLTFALQPGMQRGIGNRNKFVLPAGVLSVQLKLDVAIDDEFKLLRAEINTALGTEVWIEDGLKLRTYNGKKSILLKIPGFVLAHDDYLLTLRGKPSMRSPFEVIETYQFSVIGD